MDRWNELIAGHVLGNLTAEESEELAQILENNPQLNEEILRLRRTATVRSKLPESPRADRNTNQRAEEGVQPTTSATSDPRCTPAGSEGWTDGLSGRLRPAAQWKIKPALSPRKNTLPLQLLTHLSSQRPLNDHNRNRRRVCTYAKDALRNPLWWFLVLVAIGLGIDNMRVRRSLALIKDKTTYTHGENTHSTLWQPSDNSPKTQ